MPFLLILIDRALQSVTRAAICGSGTFAILVFTEAAFGVEASAATAKALPVITAAALVAWECARYWKGRMNCQEKTRWRED